MNKLKTDYMRDQNFSAYSIFIIIFPIKFLLKKVECHFRHKLAGYSKVLMTPLII